MNRPARAILSFLRQSKTLRSSPDCFYSVGILRQFSAQENISSRSQLFTRSTFSKITLPAPITCCHFSIQGKDRQDETGPPEKKPSLYQRFKIMYKEYWYVLLPVHVATSAMWLGGFYYLAVSGVDIGALLEVVRAPESWILTVRESKAGGIVTAYAMYKIATPARYTVTLGGTTFSINYLKKLGWIKPMPSREKLKEMYDNQKTVFKDKVSATRSEIKDEFTKTTTEITQHMKEARTGFKQSVNETKHGFKEGVKEAADEWRHIGKLIKRNVKEVVNPEKKDK